MPIKITTASEAIQVDTLVTTIYSQPGLGKTSLAFTASAPLLLDFDKGAHRAVDRKDTVQVSQWSDVADITATDVADYDTIVIDTVGKALDALALDVIAKNSRHAYGGALNQQGWGQLGVRFSAYLRKLRGFGKDVILLSHMDEQKDGDAIKERLKIAGGSKDLVLTDSDMIARIVIHNRERALIFNPTETAFGKDPARLEMLPIPAAESAAYRTCMADILARAKDALNADSEAQALARVELKWFEQAVPEMMDADAINAVLGRAKRAGREASKLVMARAEALGLEFDPATKGYVYLEEMPDAPEIEPVPEAAE